MSAHNPAVSLQRSIRLNLRDHAAGVVMKAVAIELPTVKVLTWYEHELFEANWALYLGLRRHHFGLNTAIRQNAPKDPLRSVSCLIPLTPFLPRDVSINERWQRNGKVPKEWEVLINDPLFHHLRGIQGKGARNETVQTGYKIRDWRHPVGSPNGQRLPDDTQRMDLNASIEDVDADIVRRARETLAYTLSAARAHQAADEQLRQLATGGVTVRDLDFLMPDIDRDRTGQHYTATLSGGVHRRPAYADAQHGRRVCKLRDLTEKALATLGFLPPSTPKQTIPDMATGRPIPPTAGLVP